MNRALVIAALSMSAGLPRLGQQTEIVARPGSGVVRERDKPHGFWGNKRKHMPRVLTDAQRAKHTAKMRRRYERWARGIIKNPCLRLSRAIKLLGLE
jgi:hypothetical protein